MRAYSSSMDPEQRLHDCGLELEAMRDQLKQRMLSMAFGFPTAEQARAWREWNEGGVTRLEQVKANLIEAAFAEVEEGEEAESYRRLAARLLDGCDTLIKNINAQQVILDPMIGELEAFEALSRTRLG